MQRSEQPFLVDADRTAVCERAAGRARNKVSLRRAPRSLAVATVTTLIVAAGAVGAWPAHDPEAVDCPCAAPQATPPTVLLEGDPIDKLIAYLECLLRRLRGLPCEGDPPPEGLTPAQGASGA